MTVFHVTKDRDANYRDIDTNEAFSTSKTVNFAATAGNGAVGTITLFTVTGVVAAYCFGQCTSDLTGASATVSLGTVASAATWIGATTATGIDNGHIWVDTSPAATENYGTTKLINASNIIATVATADVTGGSMVFHCLWRPISPGSSIVAA